LASMGGANLVQKPENLLDQAPASDTTGDGYDGSLRDCHRPTPAMTKVASRSPNGSLG